MKYTYTMDGRITTEPKISFEGNDFFRKMTYCKRETEICELLMKNPHQNIVKIYGVTQDYIDMELLETNIPEEHMCKVKDVMIEVKTYLQKIGIMYIDWKLDNICISDDGQFNLFDYDVSGLIDIETREWRKEPPKFWSYNEAVKNGMKTPTDIDNYAFEIGLC